MKRKIEEQKYQEIAKEQYENDPLHWDKVKTILDSDKAYILLNQYPYIEFDGKKVLQHYILCAKTDEGAEKLSPEILGEMQKLLFTLKAIMRTNLRLSPMNTVWITMTKYTFKSVKRFHTHILILEK